MKRKWIVAAVIVALLAAYGYRVYAVNTSEIVKYAMPETIEYQVGEAVELVPGYYNAGYADLSGYHVKVTGARIVKISDILKKYGCDEDDFYDTGDPFDSVDRQYQHAYVLDAVFWFDGDNDPLANAIDLSNFKLVGSDYYCNFSYTINKIEGYNPILDGNCMFSIGSGKNIELELPFLVNSDFYWSISPDYLMSHPPKLMVSQYPYEVYLALPDADM